MNFLLQSASSSTHRSPVIEPPDTLPQPPPEATKPGETLEGLIAEEPFPLYPSVEDHLDRVADGSRTTMAVESQMQRPVALVWRGSQMYLTKKRKSLQTGLGQFVFSHHGPGSLLCVSWYVMFLIASHHLLFYFRGSSFKSLHAFLRVKETDNITPFKVAEVRSRTGQRKVSDKQNGDISDGASTPSESGEPRWSKKSSLVADTDLDEKIKSGKKRPYVSAFVDREDFNHDVAGGGARSRGKCCALPNGDIVAAENEGEALPHCLEELAGKRFAFQIRATPFNFTPRHHTFTVTKMTDLPNVGSLRTHQKLRARLMDRYLQATPSRSLRNHLPQAEMTDLPLRTLEQQQTESVAVNRSSL